MIHKLESNKDFDAVVKDFGEAAKRHKFGLLANHVEKEIAIEMMKEAAG